MNKTAIKNFAIWARNKLIADIHYRAGLIGITTEGIANPLPQSTGDTEFYDIGTAEPYSIHGQAVKQRKRLVELLNKKAEEGDYATAYKYVLEEVAYTWFNRLIAVRFMEVNDYLPSHIRVLSSESGKVEPDLVTTPFDADLEFTDTERASVIQMKQDNQLDELFRLLFIKECNALNEILPALFEKTNDYTELLLSISVVDKEGVVYHLVNDISEEDFDVEKGGQVEIIGWLYQYYNTEPKAEVFGRPSGTKIKKEDIPAATQLFTPDWIVRYMVENSLGRLWVEGHPEQKDIFLPSEAEQTAYREDHSIQDGKWHYYLEEAEQEVEVQEQLAEIRKEYARLNPEDIRCIDPCMGSGHILVYLFDVLMQIYEAQGYTRRVAAQSILINNLYGLDIDDRAAQMAYFAVMMKARQYDRRILTRGIVPHVYAVQESNGINRNQLNYFGISLSEMEKNTARMQLERLLNVLIDAKEYGSILQIENYDWNLLRRLVNDIDMGGQISMSTMDLDRTQASLKELVEMGQCLAQKYDVVVTNPPYRAVADCNDLLNAFVKKKYPNSKNDLSTVFMERTISMCDKYGIMAMINIPVWMSKSSFTELRKEILSENTFINMLHCGRGIFGSDFGTTAFIIGKTNVYSYISTFYQLFDEMGAVDSVRQKELWFFERKGRYAAKQRNFLKISSYPIAYSTSQRLLEILDKERPLNDFAYPRKGLTTGDNNKFVRLWFEVDINKFSVLGKYFKWVPMTKGGDFRRWYGNNSHIVNWENDGFELKNFKDQNGKTKSVLRNSQFYFRECVSWNDTTATGKIAFRYQPPGYISNASGPCVFADQNLQYLFGLLNSVVSQKMLEILAPNMKFEVGQMALVPVIVDSTSKIEELVVATTKIVRADWDAFETSWDFLVHPLVHVSLVLDINVGCKVTIEESFNEWKKICETRFLQLKAKEQELNRIFIKIYGLQDELTPDVADKDVTVQRIFDTKDDIPEFMKGSNYVLTRRDVIVSLISYAVGCMFGRYSLDVEGLAYAGGEWDASKYSTYIPDVDNILPITDEEYFEDDIVGLFCAWIKKVYGADTLEENLSFIANILGNKGNSSREVIRNYFLKDFYKDHCQNYSVTGSGKRPIYWLFDSGKQNGFKALVYLHRYNADTIGNLRVDYLHRMQRIYESEITRMQDMIDNSTSAREVAASTKRKDKLQKQLKECQEYDEKIGHLALSRIELDLDDGVKVNYRKVQTARDGKFYEVLADSKNIMGK